VSLAFRPWDVLRRGYADLARHRSLLRSNQRQTKHARSLWWDCCTKKSLYIYMLTKNPSTFSLANSIGKFVSGFIRARNVNLRRRRGGRIEPFFLFGRQLFALQAVFTRQKGGQSSSLLLLLGGWSGQEDGQTILKCPFFSSSAVIESPASPVQLEDVQGSLNDRSVGRSSTLIRRR